MVAIGGENPRDEEPSEWESSHIPNLLQIPLKLLSDSKVVPTKTSEKQMKGAFGILKTSVETLAALCC